MNASQMSTDLPVIHLKTSRPAGNPNAQHPWIFQKMVEKPTTRPKPGSVVEIIDRDGEWIGRGFYNGHSRITLRVLETERSEPIDQGWFSHRIAAAVRLRRELLGLDAISDAWRVVHAEGDGLSGLVVDRYGDLLVVEFFSAGMWRHREWIFEALREQFPGCRFYAFAEDHVQKQESFDHRTPDPPTPAIISEHGVKFRASPGSGHKTGFFADQRDNREWFARHVAGKRVLDLCCNSGGFGIYAKARGNADEVIGLDLDEEILAIAKKNAQLNDVKIKFVQADLFPWLREAAIAKERFDAVVLDPAKLTRDREQVIPALKKYLDMNKLALSVVAPGGLFLSCSCTGLVSEEQFLDMLRRAAFYANRKLQVLKVSGAGADHPFHADVPESRYLKAAFCRVE